MKLAVLTAALLAFAAPAYAGPYQEGIRDYREGLCYRARPYAEDINDNAKEKLWIKGYEAHQTKKQGRRMDKYCYGTRGRIDNHLFEIP